MEAVPELWLGVVCEARRLVRGGGRRGVVGREGIVLFRVREWESERGRDIVVVVVGGWCDVVLARLLR